MQRLDLGPSVWGHKTQMLISDNEIITTEEANVTPLLDSNQRMRNEGEGRKKSMRHVASVDLITYHNWRKEWKARHADKWEWKTYLSLKLRDRDYSKFRTSDMKI